MEWSCSGFQTMHIDSPLIQCGWYSESSFVSHLCGTQNAFSCSNNIITMIRSSGKLPFSLSSRFLPLPPLKNTMLLKHCFIFSEKSYKNYGCFHTSNQTTQRNEKIEKAILEMLVLEEGRFNWRKRRRIPRRLVKILKGTPGFTWRTLAVPRMETLLLFFIIREGS